MNESTLAEVLVAKHAFTLPRDSVYQHHRGRLSATDNVIAQRPFVVDLKLDQAFVNPFVAPRQQHQPVERRQAIDTVLVEGASCGLR